MPVVELAGSVAQHLLDGDAQPAHLLLPALDIGDRLGQPVDAALEVAAAGGDERIDLGVLVGRSEERP